MMPPKTAVTSPDRATTCQNREFSPAGGDTRQWHSAARCSKPLFHRAQNNGAPPPPRKAQPQSGDPARMCGPERVFAPQRLDQLIFASFSDFVFGVLHFEKFNEKFV